MAKPTQTTPTQPSFLGLDAVLTAAEVASPPTLPALASLALVRQTSRLDAASAAALWTTSFAAGVGSDGASPEARAAAALQEDDRADDDDLAVDDGGASNAGPPSLKARLMALGAHLADGATPAPLLARAAVLADDIPAPAFALDCVRAARSLSAPVAPEHEALQRALLETEAGISVGQRDGDAIADVLQRLGAIAPDDQYRWNAIHTIFQQPFDGWVRVGPPTSTKPLPGLALDFVDSYLHTLAEALSAIEVTLRRVLGDACPLPSAAVLRGLTTLPIALENPGVSADGDGDGDGDGGAVGNTRDLWWRARRLWVATCITLVAAGEPELRAPRTLKPARVDLPLLRRTLETRRDLLDLYAEHGTWGDDIDAPMRSFLENSRFGGANGVSMLALPPALLELWQGEIDAALIALSLLGETGESDENGDGDDDGDGDGDDGTA